MFHDVYKQWNKQTYALHLRLLLNDLNRAYLLHEFRHWVKSDIYQCVEDYQDMETSTIVLG